MSVIKVSLFAVFLGFLGFFGSDLYLPAIDSMLKEFGTTADKIQFSVAIYIIGFSLSPLIYGPFSDRFGRKPIVVVGLVIALLGALVASFSQNITQFLVARTLQGVGAGATLSMFRVLVRDVAVGKRMAKIASYTTMIFNLSPVLGMVVGGYIVHYADWRLCFDLLIACYLIFMLAFIFLCPETLASPTPLEPKKILSRYGKILGMPVLVLSACISGLALSVIFAFATAGPLIFQRGLGVTPVVFGYLGILLSLASIFGKVFNAYFLKHLSLKKIIIIGVALIFLAGVVLSLLASPSVAGTILLISLAAFGTAFMLSNAMAIGMKQTHNMTGTAASIYGSIQLLVTFVGSSVLAHFPEYGKLSLGVYYIVAALLAGLCLLLLSVFHNCQKA